MERLRSRVVAAVLGIGLALSASPALGALDVMPPDVSIRPEGGRYRGVGVFNESALDQSAFMPRAARTAFDVRFKRVQCCGTSRFRVTVRRIGSGYTVRYLHAGTDVTASVVAGTYRTRALAYNGTDQLRVIVRLKPGAPAGAGITVLINGSFRLSRTIQATDTVLLRVGPMGDGPV